ncbi:tRNA (guanine-N1)-methyltransferase [sediment metagenome]|uniref:tRNA (Guanine-N1)-methyltransferase n=1 Tax=sediment metagenome TaxID=749907 RepID=D9PFC5_9ZZZZ
MLNYHIITLFPEMFNSYLGESILKRAIKNKIISVKFYNPRDFAKPSKNSELLEPIDDKPFGGGVGMLLKAEFYLKAIKKAIGKKKNINNIFFSTR